MLIRSWSCVPTYSKKKKTATELKRLQGLTDDNNLRRRARSCDTVTITKAFAAFYRISIKTTKQNNVT